MIVLLLKKCFSLHTLLTIPDGTLLSDVEYFAHVTCGNGISTKSVQIAYRMEELILGLYCDADKYVAKAPGIITVSTSRESGKYAFYCVKYPYLILTSAYVLAGANKYDQTRIFLK